LSPKHCWPMLGPCFRLTSSGKKRARTIQTSAANWLSLAGCVSPFWRIEWVVGCFGWPLQARVHPGESNASWMMKGALDFLLSAAPDAMPVKHLNVRRGSCLTTCADKYWSKFRWPAREGIVLLFCFCLCCTHPRVAWRCSGQRVAFWGRAAVRGGIFLWHL
jgi:hypothetical protein